MSKDMAPSSAPGTHDVKISDERFGKLTIHRTLGVERGSGITEYANAHPWFAGPCYARL